MSWKANVLSLSSLLLLLLLFLLLPLLSLLFLYSVQADVYMAGGTLSGDYSCTMFWMYTRASCNCTLSDPFIKAFTCSFSQSVIHSFTPVFTQC